MKRKTWITLTAVPVFGLAALFAAGVTRSYAQDAPQPTLGEKIKEKAGNAVTSIKKGALSAEDALKEKYAQARAGIVKMEIEARVYARLHWEKALVDSRIDLHTPSPGVVVLSGTVASEKAKAKASELTADTVGVTQVTNNLLVVLTTATPTSTAESVKP
jgi:hyperosmotically inducible periplasmic protein